MRPYSRVYASVNLDAIEGNIKAMRAAVPETTAIMGIVKADGYGHGAVPVAKTIEPFVRAYGTATLEEAVMLRRHGIKKWILVLGPVHPSQYEELLEWDIRPAVFQYEKADLLSQLAVKKHLTASIHIVLDTGMSRIGLKPDEASVDTVEKISRLPGIRIEGLFTHFARADEADKSAYEAQFSAYEQFCALLKKRGIEIPLCHCSNSAAIGGACFQPP